MRAPGPAVPGRPHTTHRGWLMLVTLGWLASSSTARAWPLSDGGHRTIVRVRSLFAQADAALIAGDVDGAAITTGKGVAALAGSGPVLDDSDRAPLAAHGRELGARILAARSLPRALVARDDARSALAAARAAIRRSVAGFDAALAAASACAAAAAPAGADVAWPVPPSGTRLAEVALACDETAKLAHADREAAIEAARFRADAIRALLRGDRVGVFTEHGEPTGAGTPVEVAHARTWHFVEGPTGPLRTVETWTFEFRGDRLVSSRRVTTHDLP